MSEDRLTLEDVERLARLAGLSIDPAFLPGVTRNLATLLDQVELFTGDPIDPIVEPAAHYRP
jgi:Asp-tRNA(Asn)/Glu-tRNA(Gln) amidotransferase C subunit